MAHRRGEPSNGRFAPDDSDSDFADNAHFPAPTTAEATERTRSVRGPASALTSFLREHGIRARNLNPYITGRIQVEDEAVGPVSNSGSDSDSSAEDDSAEDDRPAVHRDDADADADDFAHVNDGWILQQGADVSVTPRANYSNAEKRAQSSKRPRSRKGPDPPGGDPGGPGPGPSGAGLRRTCLKCRRLFTGTLDESLCAACVTAVGGKQPSSGAKRTTKRARKDAADVLLGSVRDRGVMSLREQCVRLVCEKIEHVEALGALPPETRRRIARILSKLRRLDRRVLELFVDPAETALELYDCTLLDPAALLVIPRTCANLESLHLAFCGRMSDDVLDALAAGLPHLRQLTLKGCFLVTDDAWARFFERAGARLVALHLEHAAKLGARGSAALVRCCRNLREVRLRECERLGGAAVAALGDLPELAIVDVSGSGGARPSQLMDSIVTVPDQQAAPVDPQDDDLADRIAAEAPELYLVNDGALFREDSAAAAARKEREREKAAEKLAHVVTDSAVEALLLKTGPRLATLALNAVVGLTSRVAVVVATHCDAGPLARLELGDVPLTAADFCALLVSPEVLRDAISGLACDATADVSLDEMDAHELADLLVTHGPAQLAADVRARRRLPSLGHLNLERCSLLDDTCIALLAHVYGPQLRTLSLKGLDELTRASLLLLAHTDLSPRLETLDVSWVRAVDDLVVCLLAQGTDDPALLAPSARPRPRWLIPTARGAAKQAAPTVSSEARQPRSVDELVLFQNGPLRYFRSKPATVDGRSLARQLVQLVVWGCHLLSPGATRTVWLRRMQALPCSAATAGADGSLTVNAYEWATVRIIGGEFD